jgi:hypothetical protein
MSRRLKRLEEIAILFELGCKSEIHDEMLSDFAEKMIEYAKEQNIKLSTYYTNDYTNEKDTNERETIEKN